MMAWRRGPESGVTGAQDGEARGRSGVREEVPGDELVARRSEAFARHDLDHDHLPVLVSTYEVVGAAPEPADEGRGLHPGSWFLHKINKI